MRIVVKRIEVTVKAVITTTAHGHSRARLVFLVIHKVIKQAKGTE